MCSTIYNPLKSPVNAHIMKSLFIKHFMGTFRFIHYIDSVLPEQKTQPATLWLDIY